MESDLLGLTASEHRASTVIYLMLLHWRKLPTHSIYNLQISPWLQMGLCVLSLLWCFLAWDCAGLLHSNIVWLHIYTCPAVSGKYPFLKMSYHHRRLQSFCPLFNKDLWALRVEEVRTTFPSGLSTSTCHFLHFISLWVSGLIATHCEVITVLWV